MTWTYSVFFNDSYMYIYIFHMDFLNIVEEYLITRRIGEKQFTKQYAQDDQIDRYINRKFINKILINQQNMNVQISGWQNFGWGVYSWVLPIFLKFLQCKCTTFTKRKISLFGHGNYSLNA